MEALPNFTLLSSDEKDKLIISLYEQLQELRIEFAKQLARVKELEGQLTKNSRNSSKPPSSDGFKKPDPKSQRKKSEQKTGGQAGHVGSTLKQVENPDFFKKYTVEACTHCQNSLKEIEPHQFEARQEFEIPPAKMQVTEHQAEIVICPKCGHVNKALFPTHITQPVQYGKRVKAVIAYYSQHQLLPYERLQNIFHDIHGLSLSEGTLYNTNYACHERLEGFEQVIKQQIKTSELAHFDESGLRVKEKLHWLHVASTDKLTHYAVHQKRGSEAMDEINLLTGFKGRAIHDHWQPYFKYDCKHSLCNAHHLRELTYHHEHYEQAWCKKMMACLLKIKCEVDEQKGLGKTMLLADTLTAFKAEYDQILSSGLEEIPTPQKENIKKRGRKKQHPTKNLWDRLSVYSLEILAFMYDFKVPFTNNQGEQDIRMIKVKQKISGCFRSFVGAKIFCRTRSYLSTMRKQGVNILDALIMVFDGIPFIPNQNTS